MAHFSDLMQAVAVKEVPLNPNPEREREQVYVAALHLVQRVDEDLRRGVRHYRDRAGQLLTSLDEVVRAMLDDNLMLAEVGVECGDVKQTTPAPAHLYR